jgi:hypothetical protein
VAGALDTVVIRFTHLTLTCKTSISLLEFLKELDQANICLTSGHLTAESGIDVAEIVRFKIQHLRKGFSSLENLSIWLTERTKAQIQTVYYSRTSNQVQKFVRTNPEQV